MEKFEKHGFETKNLKITPKTRKIVKKSKEISKFRLVGLVGTDFLHNRPCLHTKENSDNPDREGQELELTKEGSRRIDHFYCKGLNSCDL